MLKIESDAVGATRNDAGHVCDACRASASAVYCRADLAFLCTSCDSQIHTAAATTNNCRHERVRVCESCRRAPAALLCKADSAFLCPACDSDIHDANPLARRHMRVPIQPIYGPVDVNSIHLPPGTVDGDDEDEAASWLLMNPLKNGTSGEDAALFDDYLDLNGGYNSCHNFDQSNDQHSQHKQQHSQQDYSVPIGHYENVEDPEKNHCFQLGLQYQQEQQAYSSSLPNSISFSSMDVGIVPESTSEVSNSHSISVSPKGGINDLLSSASVLSPLDREARVLRYREKKKNRKFEKTIRYASRKAYAETRPRIKGRFAKRTEMDVEEGQMFCSPSIVGADGGYGVVPLI